MTTTPDANGGLGKAIAIRRVELGMSRNDLRDRCGLSYPYIAELEKGRKTPSGKALDAIATALQMRPHELLARAEALAGSGETPPLEPSSPVSGRWFAGAPTSRAARFAQTAPRTQPLTEERVREIVREKLRRLLAETTE